jgi:hypothetical protein
MTADTPDLSGVYLKLDRAQEHIQSLREEVATFRNGDPPPFGFRTEQQAQPDKSVEYVLYAVVREQPPRRFAVIIGDTIHNIRSALDHLAYELSSSEARKSRSTGFPIFTDESQFKQVGLPRIQSIAEDERELIERVQPYVATNPPRNDPLAILNTLSNLDKHRLLVPFVAAVDVRESWVASDNAEIKWNFIEAGPVEDGARIVGFTATPRDPSVAMEVDTQSGLQIELRDTGADHLEIEVVDLLAMIHHHVRHTVIGAWFEYGYMPPMWTEVQEMQSKPSAE